MDFPGNSYPNPDNFQSVSFPQGLTPPDSDPDEPIEELIRVTYSLAWLEVLLAAVDQLCQYSAWEGSHEEKILAVNRAQLLKWQLQFPLDDLTVPAPYWDEEPDADEQLPIDEQDWYGQVEDANAAADEMTFSQNAVIWLLTGFVAFASSPSGVGAVAAAVTFRTLATRFVLAFNKGDVREQFRVIIDAKDYGVVDSDDIEEGEVMELPINGLDDADFHDILIVVTNP